jgi:hypothetical protein
VKFSRRGSSAAGGDTAGTGDTAATAQDPAVSLSKDGAPPTAQKKGRATPKRRDAEGRRGPVSAPRTRKEAVARQRQLAREQRAAGRVAKPRSAAEQRAALRRGDESALPRRDKGPTRQLARDYVDSHRMFSNYLLLLFPLMIAASFIPQLSLVQIVVIVVFLGLLVEWYIVGRRVRELAIERNGNADGTPMSLGFYAGSRAYLPRKWRMPAPRVQLGDDI